MNNSLMFSSTTDEWATPQKLFNVLHEEFLFTWDVAATKTNAKCPDYFGPDNAHSKYKDGLTADWSWSIGTCWMNQPYSRGLQARFIAKAAAERLNGVTTVALLPARTDTKAFHEYVWNERDYRPLVGVNIRFLRGRLKFGGATNSAPFPSMIVIFHGV